MKISKKDWKKYTDTQEAIRMKAAELMKAWIVRNGTDDREAMVRFANGLVSKYGEAAAAYACEMYDRIAYAEKADVRSAVPAELPSIADIAKVINGAMKHSIAGLEAVRAIERLVKQSGADTMLQNASRDSAEYAWIPDGGACPFCSGIGAEGWKVAHMKMGGDTHAKHIHASCNCEFAIRFNEDSDVDGYDPEALAEELAENSEAEIRAEQREDNRDERIEQRKEASEFNQRVLEEDE